MCTYKLLTKQILQNNNERKSKINIYEKGKKNINRVKPFVWKTKNQKHQNYTSTRYPNTTTLTEICEQLTVGGALTCAPDALVLGPLPVASP